MLKLVSGVLAVVLRRIALVLPGPLQTELKILRVRGRLALDLHRVRPPLPEVVPAVMPRESINCALRNAAAVQGAIEQLHVLKLRPHEDRTKNWDAYRAFSFILSHGSDRSVVLDAGSGSDSTILRWLRCYRYKHLFACDLVIRRPFQAYSIQYSNQDIHNSAFPPWTFDFITCLSVIEHGVDVPKYLREMYRLLKPNGFLISSTDFYHESIDTRGIYPYGDQLGQMRVFTPQDIDQLIETAANIGLFPIGPVDYSCEEAVVHWKRVNRRFTYLFFILQKVNTNLKMTC